MSGGRQEYVAAYLDSGTTDYITSIGSLVAKKDTKYVEVYTIGTSDSYANNFASWSNIKGNAIFETRANGNKANGGWDGDYSFVTESNNRIFVYGGMNDMSVSGIQYPSRAGIFACNGVTGEGGNASGFRVVFCVKSGT